VTPLILVLSFQGGLAALTALLLAGGLIRGNISWGRKPPPKPGEQQAQQLPESRPRIGGFG
jgi:hypothetical protein